ncbi:hypothetical protein BGW37DRAFT_509335 [Umbelopsis sp. PMI_123]|nr:hypothetical protein BGW37DRAFT_509335 [Umbelopsis sp. PMI_123]
MTNSSPQRNPNVKRTRNLTACMRCRELKKKCDNGTPSCSRCLDFGANCLYLTYEQYQRGLADSINALGNELEEFEYTIQDLFVKSQDDTASMGSSTSSNDTNLSLKDELETELVDQEDMDLSPNTRKFYQYLIINRVNRLSPASHSPSPSPRPPTSPSLSSPASQEQSRIFVSAKSASPWQMRVYHTGLSIQTNIQTFKDLHDLFKSHHHPHPHLP